MIFLISNASIHTRDIYRKLFIQDNYKHQF